MAPSDGHECRDQLLRFFAGLTTAQAAETLGAIEGSDEVDEVAEASYEAFAYYDNGSAVDVTDSAVWSVEPENVADAQIAV